jgi:phosphotriesterase-related protein
MGMKIRTVCGDIAPSELEFCHSHDHIMVAKGKPAEVDSSLCMDDFDKSLAELMLFKNAGGNAIVDCQPIGAGRMSPELAELSKKSGVHIVAATGFHKMALYADKHWVFEYDETELSNVFTHELTTGMFQKTETAKPTDFHSAKAGVVKVAYYVVGLTRQYEKLFSAAAAAQVKTRAPMIIHIDNGCDPLVLDDFLSSHDVENSKRIYCHLDRAVSDIGVHIELLKRGAYVEYDTIHRLKYHSDIDEIAIMKQIIAAGFEDKILLGLDSTRARFVSYGGTPGLDYIKNKFIALMEQEGISGSLSFMRENPAKAFAY